MNKEDILNTNKEELIKYRDSIKINRENKNNCSNCYDCSNCSYCYNCYYCYDCYNCSYCYECHNLVNALYCKGLKLDKKDYDKYYICNVEVTKEEFETKKKELGD